MFIEYSAFRRARERYLADDEDFRALQNAILKEATRIDTIPGTGGLKKARWGREAKGKRGGLRVIYYHLESRRLYLLLILYPKGKKDDLSSEQKRMLRRLVEVELKR